MSQPWLVVSRLTLIARLALLLVLACPAMLPAQTLTPGTWRGALAFPEGEPILVAMVVTREKGKLRLEIRPEGAPSYGLANVRERDHRVSFRWALGGGTEFECTLSGREDGRFEGHCEDTVRGRDGKFLRVALALWPDRPR
jgi:hypothetical protein